MSVDVVKATTSACTAFLGINGLTLLLMQDRILEDLHKIDQSNDPPESRKICRGIIHVNGAISLGQAFLLHVTSVAKNPISKNNAISLSLLPRLAVYAFYGWRPTALAVLLVALASNSRYSLGPTMISVFAILPPSYLVLSGKNAAQRLFHVDPGCKGESSLLVFPNLRPLRPDHGKVEAFTRFLANEHLTSAIFLLLVSIEQPIHYAAGMTSLLWVFLMLEMGYVSQTWRLVGAKGPTSQLIHAVLSALFATGFLWDEMRWP